MRKFLKIILIIVVVLAIGWFIYYLINRPTTTAPTTASKTGNNALSGQQQAQQTASKFKIISREPIFDYWTASSTQEIFYVSAEGKIAKIGAQEKNYISEQIIENINSVLASPTSQKIIVAFGNSVQPQFSMFDLVANSWTPLPLEMKSVVWSPEGNRLAAIINQNNQNNLVVIDLAKYLSKDPKQTSKALTTIVKNFSLKDLKMEWVRPSEIIFAEKPSNFTDSSAWRLNFTKITAPTLTEIIAPGNGLLVKWLKEDLGLKFQNQKSSLINWAGQTINNISYFVLPDKCALNSNSLYCFLFTPANGKTKWPDDYLQKVVYSKDYLYKFDVNNLIAPELVFDPATAGKTIDAVNFKILGNQLLFINRYDNLLYSLDISQ